MEINLDWSEYKGVIDSKHIPVQYVEQGGFYNIWAIDGVTNYRTVIQKITPTPTDSDQEDFENNYKGDANKVGYYVRPEVRPLNTTAYFTSRGDNTGVGDGKKICWNFSNSTDDVGSPPSGYNQKLLKFDFSEDVYIRGGILVYKYCLNDSYVDMWVVCPNGQYYKKNDGSIALATADTKIAHWAIELPMIGDSGPGELIDSGTASEPIPNNYEVWLQITVPDCDSNSYGHLILWGYRTKTMILT